MAGNSKKSKTARNVTNYPTVDLQELDMFSLERSIYADSYYEFFKEFWGEIEAHELVEASFMKYLCDEVSTVFKWVADWETQIEPYDLLINIAPGTSKSSIISKIGLSYLWTLNPDVQIISSSYSASPVKEFTGKFLKILRSDKFKVLYPHIQLKEDNVTKQKNTFKGARFTTSTGGSITGMHGDLIIVDDHNKPPKIVRDEQGNPKLSEGATITEILSGDAWHDDVLVTRKTHKEFTRSIYVQQRVHRQDLSGYLLKKAEHGGMNLKHICLPAEINPTSAEMQAYSRIYRDGVIIEEVDLRFLYSPEGLLDPIRMSKKVLEQQHNLMGSYVYNSQFLQKPSQDRGGTIKSKWFPIVDASTLPENLVKNYYSDTSEGKPTSDNMATICWSLYEGKMYIWEISATKQPFNEFIGHRDETGKYILKYYDKLVHKHNTNRQSRHLFEAKSTGTPYIQYINAFTEYNAIADIPKGSKMDRVNLVSGVWESGRFILVKGLEHTNSNWIGEFLEEASNFTGKEGDPDDRVDVASAATKLTTLKGSQYIIEEPEKVSTPDQKNDNIKKNELLF